jgi:hypothetical protein
LDLNVPAAAGGLAHGKDDLRYVIAAAARRRLRQIIDAGGNGLDMRRANENAKRVVVYRNAPRPLAGLGYMHFAVPASQDDEVMLATCPFKP